MLIYVGDSLLTKPFILLFVKYAVSWMWTVSVLKGIETVDCLSYPLDSCPVIINVIRFIGIQHN